MFMCEFNAFQNCSNCLKAAKYMSTLDSLRYGCIMGNTIGILPSKDNTVNINIFKLNFFAELWYTCSCLRLAALLALAILLTKRLWADSVWNCTKLTNQGWLQQGGGGHGPPSGKAGPPPLGKFSTFVRELLSIR